MRATTGVATSVVIVNWNGEQHLDTVLDALERQTSPPDQLILVDNASSDGSVPLFRDRRPDGRLVPLDTNVGFASGNLRGFEVSTGGYLVLLNNDTLPSPTWLASLIACADAHPEAGMIASVLTSWDGATIESAGDDANILGRAHHRFEGAPSETDLGDQQPFGACAGAALYRREMIEQIGFLEPSFFMNAEDSDLAFRARLAGWDARVCPDARVRHRGSASQGHESAANVYYNTRNHLWSYARCMPTPLIVKYGWLLLAEVALRTGYYLVKGRLGSYLRGLRDGLLGLPRQLEARRRIQRTRTISIAELEGLLAYPRLFEQLRRLVGR